MTSPLTYATPEIRSKLLADLMEEKVPADCRVQFFSEINQQSLVEGMNRGLRLFIESAPMMIAARFQPILQYADILLGMSLSSRTCYQLPVAKMLVEQLHQLHPLSEEQSMRVRTCVQEALINAVVHGNFGIEGEFSDIMGFEYYYEQIESKLADSYYGEKRVSFVVQHSQQVLRVTVSDEGAGHDCIIAETTPMTQMHGRGLSIVHSLADHVRHLDFGRTLEMTFIRE